MARNKRSIFLWSLTTPPYFETIATDITNYANYTELHLHFTLKLLDRQELHSPAVVAYIATPRRKLQKQFFLQTKYTIEGTTMNTGTTTLIPTLYNRHGNYTTYTLIQSNFTNDMHDLYVNYNTTSTHKRLANCRVKWISELFVLVNSWQVHVSIISQRSEDEIITYLNM